MCRTTAEGSTGRDLGASGPGEVVALSHPGHDSFTRFVSETEAAMLNDFSALSMERNPVIEVADHFSFAQLAAVLEQYSNFPDNIVGFLKNAKASVGSGDARWDAVVDELARNIAEELGSDSGGVSHYELLRRSLREEFGFEIGKVPVQSATRAFIATMGTLTSSSNPAFAAGAAFACECSAVPELRIIRALLKKVAACNGRADITEGGGLDEFMKRHLDVWEVGHRDGLVEACRQHITTPELQTHFAAGVRAVMDCMERWWTDLRKEISTIQ